MGIICLTWIGVYFEWFARDGAYFGDNEKEFANTIIDFFTPIGPNLTGTLYIRNVTLLLETYCNQRKILHLKWSFNNNSIIHQKECILNIIFGFWPEYSHSLKSTTQKSVNLIIIIIMESCVTLHLVLTAHCPKAILIKEKVIFLWNNVFFFL